MKSDEWFRARAKELYQEDGEIEVDDNAEVSGGDDDGAYVAAWVWVPLDEEPEEEAKVPVMDDGEPEDDNGE